MLGNLRNALACAALALPLLAPAPAGAQSATLTSYEHLRLGDAESALREFLSAYAKGDFLVAYWILSPEAQAELQRQLAMLNTEAFFRGGIDGGDLMRVFPAQAEMEQVDFGFLFADMMRFGIARGIEPVDVAGLPADLSKTNVPDIGKRSERTDGQVDYAVALKSYAEPVVFRLKPSPGGRWRVHQILLPGGDGTAVPFSLPKTPKP